jgi:hypothetical protein
MKHGLNPDRGIYKEGKRAGETAPAVAQLLPAFLLSL